MADSSSAATVGAARVQARAQEGREAGSQPTVPASSAVDLPAGVSAAEVVWDETLAALAFEVGFNPQVAECRGRSRGAGVAGGRAYRESLERLAGWPDVDVRAVDLSPLLGAGTLLYDGAFVAERLTTIGPLLAKDPEAVHPVVREVVSRGFEKTAVDVFRDQHRLLDLQEEMGTVWQEVDALVWTCAASPCPRAPAATACPAASRFSARTAPTPT